MLSFRAPRPDVRRGEAASPERRTPPHTGRSGIARVPREVGAPEVRRSRTQGSSEVYPPQAGISVVDTQPRRRDPSLRSG